MKRINLKVLGLALGLLVLFIGGVFSYVSLTWDSPAGNPVPAMTATMNDASIAHGEFLFKYSLTCWDCHSNEKDPNAPPIGGRPFDLSTVGPGFGMYYNSNLTPDKETGLGGWSDGEIVRAIREGVGKEGKKLFPVMPTEALKRLSDDDVLALVAYLKSIEPVKNPIPEREVSFPAKALWTFGLIKPEKPITDPISTPPAGPTAEYGKYVANHSSLCFDCHTPRNLDDGSFYHDSSFAGSSICFGEIEGDPFWAYATNLTPDKETGIGNWSEEEFVKATMYGVRPDGSVLNHHMPFAAYAFWDETGVKAVYAYLQTVQPIRRQTPPVRYSRRIMEERGIGRGEDLFRGACKGCHGHNGTGTAFVANELGPAAQTMSDTELTDMITNGELSLRMPGFGKTFSGDQIADIVAYIRTLPEP